MNYMFVCEFVELSHPDRGAKLQGGGVHGNAILTKFSLKETKSLMHKTQPFSWQTYGSLFLQPRLGLFMFVFMFMFVLFLCSCLFVFFVSGGRVAASALVDIPNFGKKKNINKHE